MRSLLENFIDAKNPDDQSDAFIPLRRFVMHSKEDPSCLSDGIDCATMYKFLQALVEFWRTKARLRKQISDEVVENLRNKGGKHWQLLVDGIWATKSAPPPSTSSKQAPLQGTLASSSEMVSTSVPLSSVCLEDLNFNPAEADSHATKLHDALQELLSLLINAESDQGCKARLNEISWSYEKDWQRVVTEKDLHIVLAGSVSSGKTTLMNSLLAKLISGDWGIGNMLPTDAFENTKAVTMFSFDGKSVGEIRAVIEEVRMTRHFDGDAPAFESMPAPSPTMFNSYEELKGRIPSLLDELTEADEFKRLIVEIPRSLDMVLADTPGLNALGLKEHLLSILAQKCFLPCFVVDVEAASPFGKEGNQVLEYLTQNLATMFPPVIIFTKFKKIEEASALKRWQKAHPKGLRGHLKDLVNRVLDELEAAGVPHRPFFAEVDALYATSDWGQENSDCTLAEVIEARVDVGEFFKDLLDLGRHIAVPLHKCRMLQLQNRTTQLIINEIHKEDGERLLKGGDLDDLKALGEQLKQKFCATVDQYFQVDWTNVGKNGATTYKPPEPLKRSTCAINRIKTEFDQIFKDYRDANKDEKSKRTAVENVVKETVLRVNHLIANDLSKYETDALDTFKANLFEKIGSRPLEVDKHFEISFWQYAGMGAGALLSGLITGGVTFFIFASAAALVGFGVFSLGAGLCLWWAREKDEAGGWTWKEAKSASWEAFKEECAQNSPKISQHVNSCFCKKVDDLLQKIEAYRYVANPQTSECEATKIQTSAKESYDNVAKQLHDLLKDKKQMWLGKTCMLEGICEEVVANRLAETEKSASHDQADQC
eukprot:Skav235077  [mRNA]  locus=scaffold3466:189694:192168:- [translate_table: standard]